MKKGKMIFETKPDRGIVLKGWETDSKGDDLIEVERDGKLVRSFPFPAYIVYDISAHASDIIDGYLLALYLHNQPERRNTMKITLEGLMRDLDTLARLPFAAGQVDELRAGIKEYRTAVAVLKAERDDRHYFRRVFDAIWGK